MKKLLSIVLALAMLLTVVVMPTGAIEGTYVAYYVGDATDGDAVTGLTAGETYTPDRMPTTAAPEGQYFVGWKDASGNNASAGIILSEGENKIFAEYAYYPVATKAEMNLTKTNENLWLDGTTPKAYLPSSCAEFDPAFYPYITPVTSGAVNIGYVAPTENEVGYLKVSNGQYGGNKSIVLVDKNGNAIQGEWDQTYEIRITYRVPHNEGTVKDTGEAATDTFVSWRTTFGAKIKGKHAEWAEEGDLRPTSYSNYYGSGTIMNPAGNTGDGGILAGLKQNVENAPLKTCWDNWGGQQSGLGRLTYGGNAYVSDEFTSPEWQTAVYTMSTATRNNKADYLPVFTVNFGMPGWDSYKTLNVELDIASIEIVNTKYSNIEYEINGEPYGDTVRRVSVSTVYDIDRAPENTSTHYFGGWYLDKEFTKSANASVWPVVGTTKLYGKFVEYAEKTVVSATSNPAPKHFKYKSIQGDWAYTQNIYAGYYTMVNGAYKTLVNPSSWLAYVDTSSASYSASSKKKVISNAKENNIAMVNSVGYAQTGLFGLVDGNGDMIVAKPNSTYKVTMKGTTTGDATGIRVQSGWELSRLGSFKWAYPTTLSGSYVTLTNSSGGTAKAYSYDGSAYQYSWYYGSACPFATGAKYFENKTGKWQSDPQDVVIAEGETEAAFDLTFYINTPSIEDYKSNSVSQIFAIYMRLAGSKVDGAVSYNEVFNVSDLTVEVVSSTVNYVVGDTVEHTEKGFDAGSTYTPNRMPNAAAPTGKYFAGWSYNGKLITDSITLSEGENVLKAVYKDCVSGTVNASLDMTTLPKLNGKNTSTLIYPTVIEDAYDSAIPVSGYAPSTYENGYVKHYNNVTWGQSTLMPIHDSEGSPYIAKPDTTYAITYTYRVPTNTSTVLKSNYDSNNNTATRAQYYMYTSVGYAYSMKISADGKTDYLRNFYASSDGNAHWQYKASNDETITYDHGAGFPFWPDADDNEWTTTTLYVTTKSEEFYADNNIVPMFTYMVAIPGTSTAKFELNIKDIEITEISINDKLVSGTVGEKSVGYYKVLDEVEDNATYKVTFSGSLKEQTGAWASVYFLTANEDNFNNNQSLIYGYNRDHWVYGTAGSFGYTATREYTHFITTDLVAVEGNALYLYVTNPDLLKVLDFISIEKVDAVANGGVSMLKDAKEDENQALRYYFSYNTTNGNDIVIDGQSYAVASRGFLLADANKVGDAAVTRATAAQENSGIIDMNVADLSKCWSMEANEDGTTKIEFSTYVKGFVPREGTYNNTDMLYVKAYVVLENGSVVYTNESVETVSSVANKAGHREHFVK